MANRMPSSRRRTCSAPSGIPCSLWKTERCSWTSAARRMNTDDFMNWLFDPLSYEFMQRGLLASVIVGVLCAIMGTYVVLRGMAFLGDALAHAILPGVAIAYLLQGNLLLGALVAAVVVALAIGFFSRQGTIKEDTAIGVLFAAALALGVALISSI